MHKLISVNIDHPLVPESPQFGRSKIIFGLNIMTKNNNNSTKDSTEFISISNVQYAGIHPYFLTLGSTTSGEISKYLHGLKDIFLNANCSVTAFL